MTRETGLKVYYWHKPLRFTSQKTWIMYTNEPWGHLFLSAIHSQASVALLCSFCWNKGSLHVTADVCLVLRTCTFPIYMKNFTFYCYISKHFLHVFTLSSIPEILLISQVIPSNRNGICLIGYTIATYKIGWRKSKTKEGI